MSIYPVVALDIYDAILVGLPLHVLCSFSLLSGSFWNLCSVPWSGSLSFIMGHFNLRICVLQLWVKKICQCFLLYFSVTFINQL